MNICDQTAALLRSDPCTRDFLLANTQRVSGPIQALGEKRAWAYAIAINSARVVQRMEDGSLEESEWMRGWVIQLLMSAQCIYLREDMADLCREMMLKVKESYSKASDIIPSPKSLPFSPIYLTNPGGWIHPHAHYDSYMICWMSEKDKLGARAMVKNQEVTFVDHLIESKSQAQFNFGMIDGQRTAELTFSPQYQTDAMAIFLEEKIARLDIENMPRQLRKKTPSAKLAQESVRVLALRERERGESGHDAETQMDSREYVNQWLVRGHLRNQWLPSKQSHELMWIDPYIKGPDGAPFKETVRDVRR